MTVQNRIAFITNLIEKSEESLKEASLLLEQGFYETSISRSYYSMFYLAQAVLATKDIFRKKHTAIHAAFGEHFAKPGLLPKMLHIKILRAFEARRVADYEVEITKSEEDAQEIRAYAKEFAKQVVPFLEKWIQQKNNR